MDERPQVSIMFSGSDFRGDHGADVLIAHDYRPDETVAALVARVLGDKPTRYGSWGDHIQIRLVEDAEKVIHGER